MDNEVDYCPSDDSVITLLNTWKKGQKQLNLFWNMWRTEYLTSLRESSSYHKKTKGQIHTIPRIGQVVLIKEDNTPRGMWKCGRIDGLNEGLDGNIRAARIYLPNGRYIQRAVNHLYPLEVTNKLNETDRLTCKETDNITSKEIDYTADKDFDASQHAGHVESGVSPRVSIRQAAITARQRINQLLEDNALFCLT